MKMNRQEEEEEEDEDEDEEEYRICSCLVTTMEDKIIMKRANRFFENLTKLRYLGMTVTNQMYIHEKIKSTLNMGSVCFHYVQNFHLLISYLSKD
jgi:hypothetical protein